VFPLFTFQCFCETS